MHSQMGSTNTAERPAGGPILVVDDDAKILRLVRTYLEREGYAVVTASDGISALSTIALHDPALVVLDLMLPELDGRAVLRELRRLSDTPVIILSARGMASDRISGFDEGADDYVPKPFSPAELVARVRAVLRRTSDGAALRGTGIGSGGASGPGPAMTSEAARTSGAGRPGGGILRHADLVLDVDRYEVTRGGAPVVLTLVEFRLLAAILEADGRVLSRDRLLDAVYGPDQADVLDRTIDVHVGRLRDKLSDDADRPRYVATVRGIGYRAAPATGAPDSRPDQSPDPRPGTELRSP